ncbi:MAG: TIGR04283 family arsenosugar biosynthesis glycosyltransferase [Bacteroidota bacterium]
MKKISVIIPTYNEEEFIENTLNQIKSSAKTKIEVIVVDGFSDDETVKIVRQKGLLCIQAEEKSRAAQMNAGARQASGDILYFLHADTIPPKNFDSLIIQSIKRGSSSGCFRLSFDSKHWFLSCLSYFTRFGTLWFRYGDQSLFVKKAVFQSLSGFREDMKIMEDQDIIKRIQKRHKFEVLKKAVITSSRRFKENGVYRLFSIYLQLFILSKFGVDQKKLANIYRNRIKSGKV